MIELDGVPYNLNSAKENCDAMIQYINQYCIDNNITNTEGEIIQIESNKGNPLYMTLFGVGYLMSRIQELLYSAGCGLSISSSSEKQMETLCDIRHIHRKPQGRTVIRVLIQAVNQTDIINPEEALSAVCIITTDLKATVQVEGINYEFRPAYSVNIPLNTATTIPLISTEPCSLRLSPNFITSFDENPSYMASMQSLASVPGQAEETEAQLRTRLQNAVKNSSAVDRAIEAILNLEGVNLCYIFMNMSISETVYAGSVAVPPRQCALFVQGYNDDIPSTFYSYMNCLTAKPVDATRYITRDYITHANQHIPVHIITPEEVKCSIRISTETQLSQQEINRIRDLVLKQSFYMQIGQSLTSKELMDLLRELDPTLPIVGIEVSLSLEEEGPWGIAVSPEKDQLLTFDTSYIYVVPWNNGGNK